MTTVLKCLRYTVYGLVALIVLAIIGVLITQRLSDGPMGPLQGGSFKTGEIVNEPVTDWSFADGKDLEFELVGYGTSRLTGLMVRDGDLYIPCDLGYMWGRFSGQTRLILHAIYIFKTWHEDATEDGRVILRIDGKRYPAQAVRVTDPALIRSLKAQLEDMARGYVAPNELGPAPVDEPNDIWFFRVDHLLATTLPGVIPTD